MIKLKTEQEIALMKEGGKILSQTLSKIMQACVPGAHTEELDRIAREEMKKHGAEPSFLGYKIDKDDTAYPSAVCISINDEVVHAAATPDRVLKDGDLVSLDIGAWYQGMATDMAATVCVGNCSAEARALSQDTKQSLKEALKVVKENAWVHEIGAAIEDYLKPKKYGIVKDLVGHGVGHGIHEDPQIPNYHERRVAPIKLKAGMCIAIEPMITLGDWHVKHKEDGWTVATADGSLAAHWEVTIAVTKSGFELITPWPTED
ncbi:MAG: type I methionyl aminopeptidase [Patescibacteria group bacterium]|jgi:methionyl aminopeptidase